MLVHGEGSDPTTYFGVHTSRDGRWLVVSGSAGTAPRDDVWIADLAGDGELRDFQVGVDAQTAAWVARDGRLWLMSDRDTPRWRLAVADPADPATWAPEAWQDVVPQQPDAVLSDIALVDGPDGGLQVLAVHAVDATDRLSVWAARRLRPAGRRRGPRRRQHLRRQRAAGGRDVGLGGLHRLRHPAVGAALGRRRADRADQLGAGGRRGRGPRP